ncbi:sensor histidine kinase [Peribacillus sp. SCS-155]|uniref:sensor histidine kinase n=1 Tax=Peribacillus sedimenti TaxID=3115297 RepID=UPI0039065A89
MKIDFRSFFHELRKRGKEDVFSDTQRRLTFSYSGLLMLFLVLFVFIVFFLLYFIILKDQEREIKSLAGQEANIIQEFIDENSPRGLRNRGNQEVVLLGVDQFFYYVVNPDGELVMGDEEFPELQQDVLRLLEGWNPEGHDDIRQVRLDAHFSHSRPNGRDMQHEERIQSNRQKDFRLMLAGQPIYYKGQFVGTIYVGKDISFAYQLFKWLLIILVSIVVLFSGVALFLSYVMSKKAMEPISRAFDRQREFVADASHELRTPLSVMLSSIDAMEMTVETQEDDFSRKLMAGMKDEVKRMTRLVGDLLTLARSDSKNIERENVTFDFRPPAEKAVYSVESLAAAKKIQLDFLAPDSLITVGDPEKLSQLLYILLDNAIKYTPERGRVSLAISVDANELVIKVSDSGIGIKPEDYDRIFTRFYRADKARSRQMGSHGLGLSIAKWIVDIHNGMIRVDSQIGQGSTFTVRIPFSL